MRLATLVEDDGTRVWLGREAHTGDVVGSFELTFGTPFSEPRV
jgi:hypothetical protein